MQDKCIEFSSTPLEKNLHINFNDDHLDIYKSLNSPKSVQNQHEYSKGHHFQLKKKKGIKYRTHLKSKPFQLKQYKPQSNNITHHKGLVDQYYKQDCQQAHDQNNQYLQRQQIFDILEKLQNKGLQKQGVKVCNYIEDSKSPLKQIGIVNSPQTIHYILETINQHSKKQGKDHKFGKQSKIFSKTARNSKGLIYSQRSQSNLSIQKNKGQMNIQKILQRKNIQNYDLIKLEKWVHQKFVHKNCLQLNNCESIIDHLQNLHLGFNQSFKQVGKHSRRISDILNILHSQYHTLYESLINTLMQHNMNLKKDIEQTKDTLNLTISSYEQQLLNIRADFDKKSSKVIQNFHKCISLKNSYEKDSKNYANALKQEKNKMKYMQECLAKAINILVQIGNQRFSSLSPEQQKAIMQLSGSFKLCPQDCKLFYQWCATIVRNITAMKMDYKQQLKQPQKQINQYALSTIGKFMIQNDSNLSIQQVKQILNNYVPFYTPNVIQIQLQSLQDIQHRKKKIKKKQSVPDLYDIRQKLSGKSVQIQVNQNWNYESKAIQIFPELQDASVMAKPRQKQKETCTLVWIRDRMKICSNQINTFVWAQRQIQENKDLSDMIKNNLPNRGSMVKESVKIQMASSLSAHKKDKPSYFKSISNQQVQTDAYDQIKLKTSQIQNKSSIIKTLQQNSLKQVTDKLQLPNLQKSLRSISSRKKQRKGGKKLLFNSSSTEIKDEKIQQIFYKNTKNEESVAFQQLKKRSKSVKNFDEKLLQEQQKQSIKQQIYNNKITTMSHRKGILVKNLDQFVGQIVDRRSMKNLKVKFNQSDSFSINTSKNSIHKQEQKEQKKLQLSSNIHSNNRNQNRILTNLIKIPRKLLTSSKYQEYTGNVFTFRIQFVQRIQQRNKVITESTMWSHKRNGDIQKICQKLQNIKDKSINTQIHNKLEILKNLIKIEVNPIIQVYLKFYKQMISAQKHLSMPQYRKHLSLAKKIPYYHRLAPLLYSLVNIVSSNFNLKNVNSLSFSTNKYYYKQLTKIYAGIKSLRNNEKQMIIQIYEELLDGRQIQLDVFVKIITHLLQTNNRTSIARNQQKYNCILDNLEQATVFANIAEVQLFIILDDYLTINQIGCLITEIRNLKKQKQINRRSQSQSDSSIKFDEKILLTRLILKIFKTLKNKKNILKKRYRPIMQLIGLTNQYQSIALSDLLYLLEALPIQKSAKNKIIYQATFYSIYWQKKTMSVPYDRVLFLFDSIKFLQKIPPQYKKGETVQNDDPSKLLLEYFSIKIEEDSFLKKIYINLQNHPDSISQSIYKQLYRVPPIIYRLTQQFKSHNISRNLSKKFGIMLVILYRIIILQQIQRIYQSGPLNMLQSMNYITSL